MKQKDAMVIMHKYELPVAIVGICPGLSVASIHAMSRIMRDEIATAISAYSQLDKYRNKFIRKCAPNNWLKMHGYPMRRKTRD
jgi:hypothetical protein